MSLAIVDREAEIRQLRAEADASGARLVLVHGRRRVGKTFLLQHAWENRRMFYHLAVHSTPDQNRRELLHELEDWSGTSIDPEDYPNWRTVFRLLGRMASEEPLVAVIDEFQYLLEDREEPSAVPSQLNAVWETELSDRDLTLVLCGSEVGTMRTLGRRGALFGRLSREIHLVPFDYRQTAAMVGPRPPRTASYFYGIFGGTPGYLAAVGENQTLEEAARETFLTPGGRVHVQIANLIEQEEGIQRPGLYRAVLAAIAAGNTTINEIAQAAGFERAPENRKQAARRVIELLLNLGYVRRERNFEAGKTTAWRHYLADNALSFWYRYVHANRSLLELGAAREVWSRRIRPDLDDYMGWVVFEEMVREAYRQRYEAWGLPPPAEWARWQGQDRTRRDIEIDLVCQSPDGTMLTGEIKWSSSPVGPRLHHGLLRDLKDLGRSGEGWARAATDPDRSAGHLYVSAAGFTESFRELADEEERVTLVSLEEMYE